MTSTLNTIIAQIEEAQATIAALEKEMIATRESWRQESEKELLVLKNQNLTVESDRQKKEIAELKKSFDDATAQIKDIAVRVIESAGSSANKSVPSPQPER